jgi:hypothetical protein
MIRKLIVVAAFFLIGLALVMQPVYGQTEIVLGTSGQRAVFTGTGALDSTSLNLGSCSGAACTMSGVAYGAAQLLSKGKYAISSPSDLTLELTDPSSGLWTAVTNGNSMTFNYTSGTTLLTGFLNLLQFQQISPKESGGQNWYLTSADLSVTGGSLEISKGMELQLHFGNVPVSFSSLLGASNTGKSEAILFGHGTLSPTPEPASVLLLGAGFLLAGGILRVRYRRHSPC